MANLLPFILFGITLVIILAFRVADKRSSRMKRIKENFQMLEQRTNTSVSTLKTAADQYTDQVDTAIEDGRSLLADIDAEVKDLQGRCDDLRQLNSVMEGYRAAMTQLKNLTALVEQKMDDLHRQAEAMDRISTAVDAVKTRVDGEEGRITELSRTATESINGLAADVQSVLNNAQHQAKQQADETQKTLDEAVSSLGKLRGETEADLAKHRMDATSEIAKKHQEATASIEKQKEAVSAELEKKRSDAQSAIDSAAKQAVSSVEAQNALLEELNTKTQNSLEESRKAFNDVQKQTTEQVDRDLSQFIMACEGKMQKMFTDTIGQIDESFQTMVSTSQVFINELDKHLSQAREISADLEKKTALNLADASRKMQGYSDAFASDSQKLQASEEERKRQSEELEKMKAEAQKLSAELEELRGQKAVILDEMEARSKNLKIEAKGVAPFIPVPVPKEEEKPESGKAASAPAEKHSGKQEPVPEKEASPAAEKQPEAGKEEKPAQEPAPLPKAEEEPEEEPAKKPGRIREDDSSDEEDKEEEEEDEEDEETEDDEPEEDEDSDEEDEEEDTSEDEEDENEEDDEEDEEDDEEDEEDEDEEDEDEEDEKDDEGEVETEPEPEAEPEPESEPEPEPEPAQLDDLDLEDLDEAPRKVTYQPVGKEEEIDLGDDS